MNKYRNHDKPEPKVFGSLLVCRKVDPDEAGRPILYGVMQAMSVSEAQKGFDLHIAVSGLDETKDYRVTVKTPEGRQLDDFTRKPGRGGFIQKTASTALRPAEPGRLTMSLLLDGEPLSGVVWYVLSDEDFARNLTASNGDQ